MTQAQLLEFILLHNFGVSATTLIRNFGEEIEQVVFNLIELGMVYQYTNGKGMQMFGVCRRWR
jgi:hypothetical protein